MLARKDFPITPDGRYMAIKGRLWRCANPKLGPAERQSLVNELMAARRAVGLALKASDKASEAAARYVVDRAKIALGERGAVWWSDGAPDYNRYLVRNTPYAHWSKDQE